MAIRDIVKFGDARLVAPNGTLTNFEDPSLPQLIEDLKQICWAAPGYSSTGYEPGVKI